MNIVSFDFHGSCNKISRVDYDIALLGVTTVDVENCESCWLIEIDGDFAGIVVEFVHEFKLPDTTFFAL